MKNYEASRLIELFHSGKTYKCGHYQSFYESIFYDRSKKSFVYKKEDFGLDLYQPFVEETLLSEEELKNLLMKDYQLDNVVANLLD